jgi:hypothetical protein
MCDQCQKCQEQVKQALEFYANASHYVAKGTGPIKWVGQDAPSVMKDQGRIARLTLAVLDKRHRK